MDITESEFKTFEEINKTLSKNSSKNEAYVQKFDFTIFSEELSLNLNNFITNIKKFLNLMKCKKFVFQVEKCPSTERLHIQGRVLFENRTRLSTLIKRSSSEGFNIHWSVTSNGCREFSYVMKDESRFKGPYFDNQLSTRDTEGLTFYPWQEDLIKWTNTPEDRKIDLIYDPIGNIGKTTIVKYLIIHHNAMIIPAFIDNSKIMQYCCNCYSNIQGNTFVIDMPRAMYKEKIGKFCISIENIKSGILYDKKYNSKQLIINPPKVYVFTTTLPDLNLLTIDRWNIIGINDKKEFYQYNINEIETS